MWELRKDPVVGEWVVLSAARARRPSDYRANQIAAPVKPGPCAFCLGHENETGAELFAFREGSTVGSSDWRVRVVRNIYPAVSLDVAADNGAPSLEVGPFNGCSMPAFGSHEVVIETPHHHLKLSQLSCQNFEEILKCYRHRITALRDDVRLMHVQVFKNQGKAAGASMEHSHSQIIALPIIPHHLELELNGAKCHYEKTGCCIFCDTLQSDIADGNRLIDCSTDFVVVAPYAPKHPYETWIVPRAHQSHFEAIEDIQLASLGKVLQNILRKMEHLFSDTSFNYMLHTSPIQGPSNLPYYHWSIRVVPRLLTVGGFELGTGCYIVPVFPEKTALELRDANLEKERDDSIEPNTH